MPFSLGSGIGQVPVIMRAQDLAGDPAKPIATAIGSGPFRFNKDLRVSGALAMFDRNPDYMRRDELPDGQAGSRRVKVDRVERRVIPDPSTAVAASQAGEGDVIEQPALDLLPLVRRTPNIRVQALTGLEEDREPQQRTDRHKTFDGTGRHKARGRLRVPGNVSLPHLPPCSPELNPVENIWDCLRDNKPGNSVFDTYDTIVDRCCAAWNWFTETPDRIRSVAGAPWTRTVKA